MLFHKQSKKAFVFPPKCGTQTTVNFLMKLNWKSAGRMHQVPEYFIEKYPNLANYQIHAFFRDPLKRFESAILYAKQAGVYKSRLDKVLLESGFNKTRETVSYDEFIDLFPVMQEACGVILKPQSDWYKVPNVTPLDFDNYETELRRVTGNTDIPIEIRNRSNSFGRSIITQKVIDFVRQEYAADYALAKERLGKEY